MVTYGKTLKVLRILRDLNQTELANMVGCKRTDIVWFETDRAHPPEEIEQKLNEVLGVGINSDKIKRAMVTLAPTPTNHQPTAA